uniref:Uncharacterized protein n=1 Tax=Brassica oleracea TaxID=3712 RepID=A0A3P6FN10_BRAOL|nr:unnamed protein product [Brassica oleracea]
MSFLNPSPTHDLLSMRASLKQGGGTATIKRQKTRLHISELVQLNLKKLAKPTSMEKLSQLRTNWPKNSNQFSKSFRKLRDLQLKEKLHILMWSLKIYLPVIMHRNWILNL